MPHTNQFPWSQIDGLQIHEDADGRLFTFFDLLASAQTEQMVQNLRTEADDAMDTLRAIFVLEMAVRDIDPPEKWDQVDELFTLWVNERLRENIATPGTLKANWEKLWQEDYGHGK